MTTTTIINRRELPVEHGDWTITEFNTGSVMLVNRTLSTNVNFHFTPEQWVMFQALVSGEKS